MYNPAHPIFGIIRSSQKIRLSDMDKLGLPPPTVSSAVECLEVLGIVREITGKRRDRIYVYDRYARILDEGTEPLPR
jgi:DNA-binding transcriptional regulator GbsR (MarR family)